MANTPFRNPVAPAGASLKVQRKFEQARMVKNIFQDLCSQNLPPQALNGWCTPAVRPVWKRRLLKGYLYRDIEVILAFSTFQQAGAPAPANALGPAQHFNCVGFVTMRTADSGERTFQNPFQELDNTNGAICIIDLMCARNGAPGVATALLNYAITEQFKRRSRGAFKYDGIYLYCVGVGGPGQPAPLLGIVGRLGFAHAPLVNQAVNNPDEYYPRYLSKHTNSYITFENQLDTILNQHGPHVLAANHGSRQPCPVGPANGMRKCV
jgi:hypothetical protein